MTTSAAANFLIFALILSLIETVVSLIEATQEKRDRADENDHCQ